MTTAMIYAAALNGNESGKEGSDELFKEMRKNGFVAVFGHSDDCVEFRGAIDDETYIDHPAYLTSRGLLENECASDSCPHFKRQKKNATKIIPLWCEGEYCWSFETKIPHEKFYIKYDGEPWCEGIVFALSDVE